MKRFLDIIFSGLGLICLSPLFVFLALWVKLDSPGPVFYRQVRVGRNNRDFKLYKFVNDPINSKSFKLGKLYGSFEVCRQKTIYRIEFNLQNYPSMASPNAEVLENTETHKCKLTSVIIEMFAVWLNFRCCNKPNALL